VIPAISTCTGLEVHDEEDDVADQSAHGQRAILLAAIGALATSGSVVLESFNLLAKHLEPLAVLAERQIYEEGKWPADMEYPIKRA
jgi:hypothetical protein